VSASCEGMRWPTAVHEEAAAAAGSNSSGAAAAVRHATVGGSSRVRQVLVTRWRLAAGGGGQTWELYWPALGVHPAAQQPALNTRPRMMTVWKGLMNG
jgi:hypothetical protein